MNRLSLFFATLALPFAAAAQDVVPQAPPELRDFQLRPNPSPQQPTNDEPTIAPVRPPNPAPVIVAPPPPVAVAPTPAPVQQQQPAATAPPARQAPAPSAAQPETRPVATVPTPRPVITPPVAVEPTEAPLSLPAPMATPAPAPAEAGPAPIWPWLVGAALLAVAGFAVARRRRPAGQRAAVPSIDPAIEERLRAAEAARTASLAAASLRPWLALDFKPGAASATEAGGAVQFELVVHNRGKSAARNVRVDARMINAGADQNEQLTTFFGAPIVEGGIPPQTIEPGNSVTIRSTLALPREEMRGIKVENRILFVPVVAFNVLYEWGEGGAGQTATSYVVGRAPPNETARMAPFRLDLGPRVYRQVSQRKNQLERIA